MIHIDIWHLYLWVVPTKIGEPLDSCQVVWVYVKRILNLTLEFLYKILPPSSVVSSDFLMSFSGCSAASCKCAHGHLPWCWIMCTPPGTFKPSIFWMVVSVGWWSKPWEMVGNHPNSWMFKGCPGQPSHPFRWRVKVILGLPHRHHMVRCQKNLKRPRWFRHFRGQIAILHSKKCSLTFLGSFCGS